MAERTFQTCRNRRNFRIRVATRMPDKVLLSEADYLAGWVRMIRQGAPSHQAKEILVRLRALHNEAGERNIEIEWDRTTGVRI